MCENGINTSHPHQWNALPFDQKYHNFVETMNTTTLQTTAASKPFDYASALAIIQDFLGEEELGEEDFS